MSDVDLSQNSLSKLAELLRGNNSGGSGAGGASGAGGGASLGNIISSSVGVVTAFTSITKNGDYAASALGKMASMVPGIGGAMQGAIKEFDQATRVGTLANTAQGVSMSFLDMQNKANKAGLSQDQYLQAVKNSGIALDAIGGNATSSAEKLLKLGNGLQDSDLGKNLKEKSNMAASELGNLAIISQYGAKANLDNPKAMEKATQFAGELATKLHQVSGVTGQTHEALTAALEERLKEPGTIMMMRRMTEQQREGYISAQASLLGMGKSVSDLSDTIAKGGRYTKDNVTALMAMGPAAGEFQRATYALTHAKTAEQKAAAEQALEKAKSHVNEFQSSQRFQNMVNRSTPEMGAAMSKIAEENRTAGRQVGAKSETGMTGVKADQANRDKTDLQSQGLVKGADGKITQDPNRALDQAASRANEKARVNSTAGTGALADMSAKIGADSASIKKFDSAMDKVFGAGGTSEAAAKKLQEDWGVLTKVTGLGKPGAASAAPTTSGASAVGNREIGKPPGRKGGSKEATGDWFENFGAETAVNLHGDEAVVPKAQVKTFMQDMQERAAKQMPKPAMDNSKNMLSDLLPKGGLKAPEVKPPELPKLSEEQLKTLAEGPGERNQGKGSPFYQEALKLQEDIKARATASKEEKKEEAPKLDVPKVDAPKVEAPKLDVPKVEASKLDVPKVDVPKVDAPKVEPKAEPSIFDRIKTQISSMIKTSTPTAPSMPKLDGISADIAKPVTPPPIPKPVPKLETPEKPVEQPKLQTTPAALPAATGSSSVSLKDLNDQLMMLNKQMGQMISHAATTAEASQKTAKSTSRPAGSRALA